MTGFVSNAADEAAARRARLFDAWKELERRERKSVTLGQLGERIARQEGRAEPYAPSVVSRWFKGAAEPSTLAIWRAIGAVLGVPPGWLAFGEPPTVAAAADDGIPEAFRDLPRAEYVDQARPATDADFAGDAEPQRPAAAAGRKRRPR